MFGKIKEKNMKNNIKNISVLIGGKSFKISPFDLIFSKLCCIIQPLFNKIEII